MCLPQTTWSTFFGRQEIGLKDVHTAANLFMRQNTDEKGMNFNVDSSTLFHFAASNCSPKLQQLTLTMLMVATDAAPFQDALLAVYKHLYFDESEGVFSRFFAALGPDACKFFKFRFFFEGSSAM